MNFDKLQIPAWVVAICLAVLLVVILQSFFTGRSLCWNPLGLCDTTRASPLPIGMVTFFKSECREEDGWRSFDAARGRYIVGVPRNGDAGATVGTALNDKENRPAGAHRHAVFDYQIRDIGQGGHHVQFRHEGGQVVRIESKQETDLGANLVPGTNAPYIQLYACERV